LCKSATFLRSYRYLIIIITIIIIILILIILIIIIITEDTHTDRCGNTCRQKCRAKESGKEVKIQQFRYTDTAKVEFEVYDYTGYNWSYWNGNETRKQKPGSYTGKTFDRFTAADSCTGNSTHNTESTAV
jgi:uncharacterized protein YxeA